MDTLKVSISGIRGIVGDSLTPSTIIEFAAAYAEHIKEFGDTIAIARDTRSSGEMVFNLCTGALMAHGINVIDFGILPTPVLIYAVKKYNYAGGIIITASHNPSEWNALKFVKNGGLFFSQEDLDKVLKIKSNLPSSQPYNELGKLSIYEADFIEEYIDDLLSYFDTKSIISKNFKIGYDPVNATGFFVTPILMKKLGFELYAVNDDISKGFSRGAEPTPENLIDLSKLVVDKKLDIGFAQDPDGDRLALVDETGNAIGEEFTLALSALNAYKYKKLKGDMVVNLSTSRMNDDVCKMFERKLLQAKVGEINVTNKMLAENCEVGGEGNGGVIFPAFNACRDSFVSMMFILELMAKENIGLSKIKEILPHYYISKDKINCAGVELESVYNNIKKKYTGYSFNEDDGLKLEANDHWIHIRPSNTEPVIRIIIESPSEEKNKSFIKEIKELIFE